MCYEVTARFRREVMSSLHEAGGKADDLIGQTCSRQCGLARGKDRDAGIVQRRTHHVAQCEPLVVGHEQRAPERLRDVGGAVTSEMQNRKPRELTEDCVTGGVRFPKATGAIECGNDRIDLRFCEQQRRGGYRSRSLDRKDGVGVNALCLPARRT